MLPSAESLKESLQVLPSIGGHLKFWSYMYSAPYTMLPLITSIFLFNDAVISLCIKLKQRIPIQMHYEKLKSIWLYTLYLHSFTKLIIPILILTLKITSIKNLYCTYIQMWPLFSPVDRLSCAPQHRSYYLRGNQLNQIVTISYPLQ